MFTPFVNEPYVDFTQEIHRKRMEGALRLVESQLGREYPLSIGGKKVQTDQRITSRNPARPSQMIGISARATVEHAEQAVQVAHDRFPDWSRVPAEVRARYLVKAAAILRRRVYEFSAWMVYEVSKTWAEAYADTCEAIDFLEFYARQSLEFDGSHATTPFAGEENEVRYIPIGVGVILAPWNFPLAIFAGMTVSAVVTGNTVVAKPAEQSPIIAAKFIEVLEEASLPPGVVNFLPGHGEDVGEYLTGHPLVRFVSFTGSRDVGLHVYQRIATHAPGQKWLKRAILEMGGKNAIIVDEDADLDAAADGIVAAAYGFQGQKCSACSRLILHKNVYDGVLERVTEGARKTKVGDPVNSETGMAAVIDEEAERKILGYIEVGCGEGRLVTGGAKAESGEGYFIQPTIFEGVRPDARIAQEEIFGPVLAVIRAESFDHALEIANGTEYGLTGGVFSRNRNHLERARHEFQVGNLYLNRKNTGALVDVQPFGGFNMSGTDSKAGGRDYLHLFVQPKAVSERW